MLGAHQGAESHQGRCGRQKNRGAEERQLRIGFAAVALEGPDGEQRIVDAHAEDDNGQHQGRDIERSPGEAQKPQRADKGPRQRQEGQSGQGQVPEKEAQQNHGAGPDQIEHLPEGHRQKLPQALGEKNRVEKTGRTGLGQAVVKRGRLVAIAGFQCQELAPAGAVRIGYDAQQFEIGGLRHDRCHLWILQAIQKGGKSVFGKSQRAAGLLQAGGNVRDARRRPEGLPGRPVGFRTRGSRKKGRRQKPGLQFPGRRHFLQERGNPIPFGL